MSDPTDLPAPASPDTPPPAETVLAAPADTSAAAPADPAPDAVQATDALPAGSAADDAVDEGTDAALPPAADGTEAQRPAGPSGPVLSPAATLALLREHFPALFAGPAKPLKLRIQQDIQQRAPGVFTRGTLSAFFRRHTTSTGYLISMTKSASRFDLDGQPAGELSEEHKLAAQAELTRRRQVTREREQQAQAEQRTAQREAQRAEMAQQAEALQARQARNALLRDFQRTTLTLANFCALKGMTPDQLNPLLEQAKKEAAEAPTMQPPHPRFGDDRRGPGPRRDDRPFGRPSGGPDGGPDGRPNAGPDGRVDRGPRGPQGPDNRGPRPASADGRPPRPGPRDGRRPPGGRGPGGQGGQGGSGPAGPAS